MKKIIIVICCFFTTVLLHAQVPGYQGKRGVFEVQAAPSLIGLLGAGSESGPLFPTTFKLRGEYAIKRKKTLGLEYRQINLSADASNYNNKTLVFLYTNYNRNWALAPNGHYFSYGLGYNFRSTKGLTPTDTTVYKDNFFSLHLMWGQRYIIGNRLSLNYGFETGIPLKGLDLEGVSDWGFMLFNMNLGLGFIF
jgi:hypothetical protein